MKRWRSTTSRQTVPEPGTAALTAMAPGVTLTVTTTNMYPSTLAAVVARDRPGAADSGVGFRISRYSMRRWLASRNFPRESGGLDLGLLARTGSLGRARACTFL